MLDLNTMYLNVMLRHLQNDLSAFIDSLKDMDSPLIHSLIISDTHALEDRTGLADIVGTKLDELDAAVQEFLVSKLCDKPSFVDDTVSGSYLGQFFEDMTGYDDGDLLFLGELLYKLPYLDYSLRIKAVYGLIKKE